MTDLATLNASAKVPCPDCQFNLEEFGEEPAHRPVYVLAGVRVPCNCHPILKTEDGIIIGMEGACQGCIKEWTDDHAFCDVCQGRTWTPNPDGWEEQCNTITLWKSEKGNWRGSILTLMQPDGKHWAGYSYEEDECKTFRAAILIALYRALASLGAKFLGDPGNRVLSANGGIDGNR